MRWNRAGTFLVSGDAHGNMKIFTDHIMPMNDFRAHTEGVRAADFAPGDLKVLTASEDGSVRVWDFWRTSDPDPRTALDLELRGHGSNVTTAAWHPTRALIASGSKDSTVRLWDPRIKGSATPEGAAEDGIDPATASLTADGGKQSQAEIACLGGHNSWIHKVSWSPLNGHWLATTSRDQVLRIFDIRMMRDFQKIVTSHGGVISLAWHPVHEKLLATGSMSGCMQQWNVGIDFPQAEVLHAHDTAIWDLQWHPLGHLLLTGSHDHTAKFWARSRPGDTALQYAYQGNPKRMFPAFHNTAAVAVPASLANAVGAHATTVITPVEAYLSRGRARQQMGQMAGRDPNMRLGLGGGGSSGATAGGVAFEDFERLEQESATYVMPAAGDGGDMGKTRRDMFVDAARNASSTGGAGGSSTGAYGQSHRLPPYPGQDASAAASGGASRFERPGVGFQRGPRAGTSAMGGGVDASGSGAAGGSASAVISMGGEGGRPRFTIVQIPGSLPQFLSEDGQSLPYGAGHSLKPVPPDYCCNTCGVKGHWRQHCPLMALGRIGPARDGATAGTSYPSLSNQVLPAALGPGAWAGAPRPFDGPKPRQEPVHHTSAAAAAAYLGLGTEGAGGAAAGVPAAAASAAAAPTAGAPMPVQGQPGGAYAYPPSKRPRTDAYPPQTASAAPPMQQPQQQPSYGAYPPAGPQGMTTAGAAPSYYPPPQHQQQPGARPPGVGAYAGVGAPPAYPPQQQQPAYGAYGALPPQQQQPQQQQQQQHQQPQQQYGGYPQYAARPPQGPGQAPPQGYPPQGYPTPQGYPPQGQGGYPGAYPPQGPPPQGAPPQEYPQQGPPGQAPPRGYPPQQHYPPRGHPPQRGYGY
jgi:hypothetical protein